MIELCAPHDGSISLSERSLVDLRPTQSPCRGDEQRFDQRVPGHSCSFVLTTMLGATRSRTWRRRAATAAVR